MITGRKYILMGLALFTMGMCFAQPFRGRGGGGGGRSRYTEGGVYVDENLVKTAREVATHSSEVPEWTNSPAFRRDVFTFVRVKYHRGRQTSYSAGSWLTDFPDSDLNLSFRVQQMTSLKVDPNARTLWLTDPALFDYPWIYMVEPGGLQFESEEVKILRDYLLNGGFLMADDFWGELQWANFERQMKRVFPERQFIDLPMEHPVFHCVFDLKGPKQSLQVPNYRLGIRSQFTGVTWETHDGEECREVHIRAILDDQGRIMVIATHNTDNGDGWEREGENDYYFHNFSEKISFPLGINIIFYAMTH